MACLILLAIVRCIPRIYDFKIISEDVEDMSDIDVVDTATSEVTQTDVDYTRSALGAQKTCEQMMDREASWTIIILSLLMEVFFICLCLITFTYIKCKKFITHRRLLKRHDRHRTSGSSFLRTTTTSEHSTTGPGTAVATVAVSKSGFPPCVTDETQRLFVFIGAFLFSVMTFPYSFFQFHDAFVSLSFGRNDDLLQPNASLDGQSSMKIDESLVILSSYSTTFNFLIYVLYLKGFREDLVEWIASALSHCCFCCSMPGLASQQHDLYSIDITTTTTTTNSVVVGTRRSGGGSRRADGGIVSGGEFAPQRSQRRPALDEENYFSLLH